MPKTNGQLRHRVAQEAARLMYEEGVGEYFTAKRIAARRLFGKQGGKQLRHRPADLPSNGEIRDALLRLAEMMEGEARTRRLFAMRVIALEMMDALAPFSPRLIGSVSTGHVRRGSDIDLHVFADDFDALEDHVEAQGWAYERREVTIKKGNAFRDYTHIHVDQAFPVELSVYEPHEIRELQISSTDGKPIVRVKPQALRALIEDQHPTQWRGYQHSGVIPELDQLIAEEQLPSLGMIEDQDAWDFDDTEGDDDPPWALDDDFQDEPW